MGDNSNNTVLSNMRDNSNNTVFPNMGDNSNSAVFLDMGDNSTTTVYTPTLHELNIAEVYRRIPLLVLIAVISLTGTIGNSLVCYMYVYRSNHRQCFIMSLAVIDLLSCSAFIPIQIYTQVIVYEFEHAWLCKMSRLFNTWAAVSASAILLVIATDRYRKVCRYFGWQIGIHVKKYLVALSILIGFVFSLPALFIYSNSTFEITKYNLTGTHCSTDDAMANSTFLLVNDVVQGGLLAFGLLYFSIMYSLIFRTIRMSIMTSTRTRDRKWNVTMCVISITFILSYMPRVLLMIIRAVKSGFVEGLSGGDKVAYTFFLDSYFLKCAVNPIIYLFCDVRFRKALKELFARDTNRNTLSNQS